MLSHATFEPSIGLQNHLTFCVTTCTSADNSATRACPNTRTLDLCPTHTCLQMIYEDVHRRENPRGHSETHAHSEETILNRLRWRLRDLLLIKASSRPSLLSPSLPTPPPLLPTRPHPLSPCIATLASPQRFSDPQSSANARLSMTQLQVQQICDLLSVAATVSICHTVWMV